MKVGKQNPIRIMLVDDHLAVRVGVAIYLDAQEDFELVAEASTGEEALVRYAREKPDIVLLDLILPDTNGIDLMSQFDQINGHTPVILLSGSKGPHFSKAACMAGKVKLVNKSISGDSLGKMIREMVLTFGKNTH